jgi:hypothetical protein
MINYDLDLSTIPNGCSIKDIEDSDCYYQGIWNNGMYTVTKVIWNGEEYKDDEMIGKTIHLQWYWIEVFDSENKKILGT